MFRAILCVTAGLVLCVGASGCEKKKKPGAGSATGSATGSAAGSAAKTPGSATGSSAAGTAAGTAADSASLKAAMKEHFRSAMAARDAVVAGKLDDAKKAAKSLTIWLDGDMVPKSWRGQLAAMKVAAKSINSADTLQAAAIGVANIADTCGHCHKALKAQSKIKVAEEPLVAGGTDVASHMARHAWAGRRLWEALVIPSDDHWTRGTAILLEKHLEKGALAAAAKKHKKKVGKEVSALAEQVHKLGEQAAKAKGDTRSALYGQLLATCASCHAVTRDK
ncbi:MAG: hypothetical protein KC503_32165 [Myxococcales bacterium]|nr:hypothetical protein [Myxococcales bacterium]